VANLFHHGPDPTFADLYRLMSEQELQDLLSDWHSLIPEAHSALVAEFATRGLEFTEPAPPADDTPPEFRDLTTIRRYRDLSEALVARAVIESAGIFCFLKDENLVRLDWQVSNFIGGIRLQVAAVDVEAANDILSQPVPNEIFIPDQPGFLQPRCPRCTSTDIAWERQGRKAALASLYLFSLPLPRGSESWHCNSCDLRWVDDESAESASHDNNISGDSQP
jgi:Putative prokaryotic signal transducing protein